MHSECSDILWVWKILSTQEVIWMSLMLVMELLVVRLLQNIYSCIITVYHQYSNNFITVIKLILLCT